MSKRNRAARADTDADTTVGSATGLEGRDTDLDVADLDADDSASAGSLRPTGKRSGRRRGSSAHAEGDGDSGSAVAVADRTKKKKASATESRNPFVRIWVFLQQVVAELKKVIWPDRHDMIVYTASVLLFVVIATAFISGIDIGFAKAVLWVFG